MFFKIVTVIGIWIFPRGHIQRVQKIPVLRSLSLENYLTFDQGNYATLAILLVALVIGLLAHAFGFHPAVGAYMAGLIVREDHFNFQKMGQNKNEKAVMANACEATKNIVDNAAFSWIGPVYLRETTG